MEKVRKPIKKHLKNEEGFTLLEIIAVIVIMSILAVVAVPKYFDLQEKARQRAFGAGISEAVGRVNGWFAQEILDGKKPSDINYNATTIGDDLGDFEISNFSDNGTAIVLTIIGKTGTEMEGVENDENVDNVIHIPRPGI